MSGEAHRSYLATFRIPGHRRGQDFDRGATFQIGVGGLVDLAHAARANLRDDFIGPEPSACCQDQAAGSIAVRIAPTRLLLSDADLTSIRLKQFQNLSG
jgi:hypothetical protein